MLAERDLLAVEARSADPATDAALAEALGLLERVSGLMTTRLTDPDGWSRAALVGPLDQLYDLAVSHDVQPLHVVGRNADVIPDIVA